MYWDPLGVMAGDTLSDINYEPREALILLAAIVNLTHFVIGRSVQLQSVAVQAVD